MIAQIFIKVRQRLSAPINQCRLDAQPVQQTGEFNTDITRSDNDDRRWERIPLKEIVGIIDEMNAGRSIWHVWPATRRHKDKLCGDN